MTADLYGDSVALLRAFLSDDVEGAARLISRLDTREVLLVTGALVQLAAGFLTDIAGLTGDTTDALLEQLVADIHRRSS